MSILWVILSALYFPPRTCRSKGILSIYQMPSYWEKCSSHALNNISTLLRSSNHQSKHHRLFIWYQKESNNKNKCTLSLEKWLNRLIDYLYYLYLKYFESILMNTSVKEYHQYHQISSKRRIIKWFEKASSAVHKQNCGIHHGLEYTSDPKTTDSRATQQHW